jgi:hypothetical protein
MTCEFLVASQRSGRPSHAGRDDRPSSIGLFIVTRGWPRFNGAIFPLRPLGHYSAKAFHLLHHAGFDPRFRYVPLDPLFLLP